MKTAVKLSEIISGIEMQSHEIFAYLNTATGEVVMFTQEELSAVEEGEDIADFPDWQQEMIKLAEEIWDDTAGKYLQLPTQFDVHEYAIMEKFCLSIQDDRISNELYYAIKGSGAFRRFKDGIYRLGVAEDWYEYRDKAFRQIAIEWCEENGVKYI